MERKRNYEMLSLKKYVCDQVAHLNERVAAIESKVLWKISLSKNAVLQKQKVMRNIAILKN